MKFGFRSDDPLLFHTRSGALVEVPRRLLQTFRETFMAECYCEGTSLPVVERPVVIDTGANDGYFTLFALARMPMEVHGGTNTGIQHGRLGNTPPPKRL